MSPQFQGAAKESWVLKVKMGAFGAGRERAIPMCLLIHYVMSGDGGIRRVLRMTPGFY